MNPQFTQYRAILENKARELGDRLRRRDAIAIETAAEETELTVLAGQRDLAVQDFDRNAQVLREVRAALDRISAGDFGACERCEKPIPPKRLQALPWARCCVPCQETADRENAGRGGNLPYAA